MAVDLKTFKKEVGKEPNTCSWEYLHDIYKEKVSPYLSLISEWRGSKEPASLEKVRVVLGVSKSCWELIRHMPLVKEHLDTKEGGYMKYKSERDLVLAGEIDPTNGKLIEMKLKRWNDDYDNKVNRLANKTTNLVNINFVDSSMEDDDIETENEEKKE